MLSARAQNDHPRRCGSRGRPPRGLGRWAGLSVLCSGYRERGLGLGVQEAGTRRRAARDWLGTLFVVWLGLRGKPRPGWRGGDKRNGGCSREAGAELLGQFCSGRGSEFRGHVVGHCPRVHSASRDHPVLGQCSWLAQVMKLQGPCVALSGWRGRAGRGTAGDRGPERGPRGRNDASRCPGPQPAVAVQPSPGFILMRESRLFIL